MAAQDLPTVLIIGSGPVGATFARLLGCAKEPRNVIMIDGGPQLSARPGWHLANAFIYQQHPNLFLSIVLAQLEAFSVSRNVRQKLPEGAYTAPEDSRVNFENNNQDPKLNMKLASATYAVGGMATHWTCCTPDPAEMERTELIPSGEWPILLATAQDLLNVHTDAFSPSLTNDVVKEVLNNAGFPVTELPMAAEKRQNQESSTAHMVTWTGSDTILGPLLDGSPEERERLTILPEHRAEKLLRYGDKIYAAEVRDLTNWELKTIRADTIIVAAGAFLTPSLLWRSDIRPSALGRYLNADHSVRGKVVLSSDIIEQLRAKRGRDEAVPIPWDEPPVMLGTNPTGEKLWHTQIQRMGQYFSYDLDEFGIPEPATDARLIHDLIWFGMVEPCAENRITFDDSVLDRFGLPQITIEYQVQGHEMIEKAMVEDMRKAGCAIGRFIPVIKGVPPGPVPEPAGSTLHYHGTCRMGNDSKTSVVDSYCKVWGFENLYLGSVGVIPNRMASNPTLTACAIAARTAARIAGRSPQELALEVGVELE